ncbi:GOLPH3/VPS74 family protein [Streptacidiphilus fuscans]|uniref:GPP34 family phosphoprotein n=1 Tax=Streptacidiphilus fuscans TaxID=2789292 RepID=A0A931BB47_9ACTN|nr:GPP34 family phosphoprotein [Streptacidiphilus fuscans]MBF9072376.1 GPP34 family phosphoprotein [Streptacidiphilus fuscans]
MPDTSGTPSIPGTPGTSSSSLPEDLLILCATGPDGRLRRPPYLDFALAGGVLAELVLAGVATIDGARLRLGPRLTASASASVAVPVSFSDAVPGIPPELLARIPAGEPRLTVCLNRLRSPGHGVSRAVLGRMVAAGLLTGETSRLLGILPHTRYTVPDPSARAARTARIAAVLASPTTASPRDLSLTTLAHAAGLTSRLTPSRLDRPTRHLLTDLTRADPLADAVSRSIRRARSSNS